jgi:hypothetical protein
MNRRSKYPGVTQRCRADCPDPCRRHTWSYAVELPAGHDGKRRQVTRAGFRSAKAAAEARADLGSGSRKGVLADDGRLTLGEWLQRHYSAKTTRGDLRPSTIAAYRILLAKYVIPQLGGYRLGQLRGHHLTAAYASILTDRAEEIAAAERRNERWRRQSRLDCAALLSSEAVVSIDGREGSRGRLRRPGRSGEGRPRPNERRERRGAPEAKRAEGPAVDPGSVRHVPRRDRG